MAIAGLDNTVVSRTTPSISAYETATISGKDTGSLNIIDYLDGPKWTVTYYNQVTAGDDSIGVLDSSLPVSLAGYYRINGLELSVTKAFENVPYTELTGSAIINVQIVPNVGDLIQAVIGGRNALLVVTESEIKHYNHFNKFEISYKLDSFLDTDPQRLAELEARTVRYFEFNAQSLRNGGPSLLEKDEVSRLDILSEYLEKIEHEFLYTAFNKEYSILTAPLDVNTADLWLEKFVIDNFSLERNPLLTRLNRGSLDEEDLTTSPWEVFNKGEKRFRHTHLFYCKRQPVTNLSSTLRKLRYLGFNTLLTPTRDQSEAENIELGTKPHLLGLGSALGSQGNFPILPTLSENEYLFSKNFYLGSEDRVSKLETLVSQSLNSSTLDPDILKAVLNSVFDWKPINKYYYYPVLVYLLNYALRTFSKNPMGV